MRPTWYPDCPSTDTRWCKVPKANSYPLYVGAWTLWVLVHARLHVGVYPWYRCGTAKILETFSFVALGFGAQGFRYSPEIPVTLHRGLAARDKGFSGFLVRLLGGEHGTVLSSCTYGSVLVGTTEIREPISGLTNMGGCQNYGPLLVPYYNTANRGPKRGP